MRTSGWLLCGVVMACTHHDAAKTTEPTNVGKLEPNPESACPPPKSASTDAAEYARFVSTAYCRISTGGGQTGVDQTTFRADGKEVVHSWVTDDASGKRLKDRQHELCWRLDGTDLHESHLDGTRDQKVGHQFDETGQELEIDIFDMSITYKACPSP